HLEHADFAVRMAAAENLAALKLKGQSTTLAAAYRRSLPDRDLDARLALVAALAGQDDAAAREALGAAARADPARVVRERAGAALRAAGLEAPAPGRVADERAALDYR